MRITRKLLRFLRTLDFLVKIRSEIPELHKTYKFFPMLFRHLTSILQNICTFIYFIYDHRVCLGELNVVTQESPQNLGSKSMKFYFLSNFFGIFNDISCMAIAIVQSKDHKDVKKLVRSIKHYSFDLIRCLLDCLVALFYWKNKFSAKITGILGVISSIMAIMQSLEKM